MPARVFALWAPSVLERDLRVRLPGADDCSASSAVSGSTPAMVSSFSDAEEMLAESAALVGGVDESEIEFEEASTVILLNIDSDSTDVERVKLGPMDDVRRDASAILYRWGSGEP